MGLIKSAADLAYTFRFLALLVTPFKKTKAFEKGIIDENGKRLKKPPFSTMDEREDYANYYTRFIRLVFNVKKLIGKVPGGKSRIASYAAALYLIKSKPAEKKQTFDMNSSEESSNNDSILIIDTNNLNLIEVEELIVKPTKKKVSRFSIENNPNYWTVVKGRNSDTSFYILKNKNNGER